MNPLKVAIDWLLKKHVKEEKKVSEALNDSAVEQQAVTAQAVVEPVAAAVVADPTPVAEVKAGVQDFEKAFQFVADGVAQLGEGAKDELVALAKKYL